MVIQGVIRPPPEIRAVADRTALYVAKNGRAFESRILNSAKGKTPKFSFLIESSPFWAYYQDRVRRIQAGEAEEKDGETEAKELADDLKKKKKSLEESRKKEKTAKASVIDPVAKALLTQRSKIAKVRSTQEEQAKAKEASEKESEGNEKKRATITIPAPPPIQFLNIVSPSSLTIAQIEMIQLVAQFAALEGKAGPFLHQLTLREWRNPAFGFLQPRHGHFAYFSALVDAYRSVLGLWTGGTTSTDDGVKGMANNVDHCLNVAAYRAEYDSDLEEQKRKQDEEGVLSAASQIDWHEFVVVETIDFPADEVVELSMLPPPPPQNIPSAAAAKNEDGGMDESEDEEEEDEQIRVVPSYTPKVVGQQSNKLEMVIDPITGKSVPVKDMPEHMRIQLLDPKWAEERKKFQEKQKDSNLVGGDIVAQNIARFAQARGDVFGKTEQNLLSKETDSKIRLEEANRIIRESQHQGAVGPSLPHSAGRSKGPAHHAAPQMDNSLEPAFKRPKTEVTRVEAPPPPPPVKTTVVQAPPGFDQSTVTASVQPFEPFATPVGPPASEPTGQLLSESEFAASLSKPEVILQIRVPNDPTQMAWNFYGQIVSVTVDVMSTVKSIKQDVSKSHFNDMPANKMQLKSKITGAFLKDNLTLAALNIGPTVTLELVPKTRGGRK